MINVWPILYILGWEGTNIKDPFVICLYLIYLKIVLFLNAEISNVQFCLGCVVVDVSRIHSGLRRPLCQSVGSARGCC